MPVLNFESVEQYANDCNYNLELDPRGYWLTVNKAMDFREVVLDSLESVINFINDGEFLDQPQYDQTILTCSSYY